MEETRNSALSAWENPWQNWSIKRMLIPTTWSSVAGRPAGACSGRPSRLSHTLLGRAGQYQEPQALANAGDRLRGITVFDRRRKEDEVQNEE